MSNELEHARTARIVLGSNLDELFNPSLWSLLNPILKPSLGISRPKTGKLHMVFVLPPLKIWFVGLLHNFPSSIKSMYLMHCCSFCLWRCLYVGMCTVDGHKAPNVYWRLTCQKGSVSCNLSQKVIPSDEDFSCLYPTFHQKLLPSGKSGQR